MYQFEFSWSEHTWYAILTQPIKSLLLSKLAIASVQQQLLPLASQLDRRHAKEGG